MPTVAVTTQPTYNVGPITGFKAKGTIQGVDGEFKDDLLVQGDLEVVGTLYVGVLPIVADFTTSGNHNITMNASGSGTFGTGTGNVSLLGDTTVASTKALAVTSADKLTVGGVIVPQELVIMHGYKAADVDHTIFIANRAYTVVAVQHMSEIADTSVSAATVGVMKCTGTQAPSSGVLTTATTCDLKTVTQVVTAKTLSSTGTNYVLAAGDRIALDFTGNTDSTGCIMVTLKRT